MKFLDLHVCFRPVCASRCSSEEPLPHRTVLFQVMRCKSVSLWKEASNNVEQSGLAREADSSDRRVEREGEEERHRLTSEADKILVESKSIASTDPVCPLSVVRHCPEDRSWIFIT